MRVLLVSTYELGHQPVNASRPAAALLAAGHDVRCTDTSIDMLDPADVDWAERVAFSVPMHTAMRLALAIADSIRARRPQLPVCFYGLYASTSLALTVRSPHDAAIAGEYLPGLMAWAGGEQPGPVVQLGRSESVVPIRRLLPELSRYARLSAADGEMVVGSVDATRGCSHRCRHCPVPVVYDGRVRATDEAAVLADIDQLVAAGADHISFSDPDFLNMPAHAQRIITAMHERHPQLTFDCTVKVEHILKYPDVWEQFSRFGCAFVVSAFESVDDVTLEILDKGHTAVQAGQAVRLLRAHSIEIRPSWLPFLPWTTVEHVVDICDFLIAHDLVRNIDPVQFTVRLLLPEGSLLLAHPYMTPHLGAYDQQRLGWTWEHPDPAVDALHAELTALVEAGLGRPGEQVFTTIDSHIRNRCASRRPAPALGAQSVGPHSVRPRLTEAWFCCSEPSQAQLAPLLALP